MTRPGEPPERWAIGRPAGRWVTLALLVSLASCARAPAPITRFELTYPWPTLFGLTEHHRDLSVSHDGRRVVYFVGRMPRPELMVRSRSELDARPVFSGHGAGPTVSEDGSWIAFAIDTQLMKVPTQGGQPEVVTDLDGDMRGVSWPRTGRIVFATDGPTGLQRVSAAGGQPEVLTLPDASRGELDHVWPQVLPGGRHAIFTILTRSGEHEIAWVSLATRRYRSLDIRGSNARYSKTGHLVFGADGALRAVAFSLKRLRAVGQPATVVDEMPIKASGAVNFDVSDNGSLVYVDRDRVGVEANGVVVVDNWAEELRRPAP